MYRRHRPNDERRFQTRLVILAGVLGIVAALSPDILDFILATL